MDEMTCGYCQEPMAASERMLIGPSWVHGRCESQVRELLSAGVNVQVEANANGLRGAVTLRASDPL